MDIANQQNVDAEYLLSDEQIAAYRRDGFIHLPDVVTGDDLADLRNAVAGAVDAESAASASRSREPATGAQAVYAQIFNQKVNLWQRWRDVARWVTGRRFGDIAERLEGVPMRLWHDQALFKGPSGGANNKTPWHQDAPYWPHANRQQQTTIWIALKDATIENGCMSFVGGTHLLGTFPPVNLADPADIFAHVPHIKPVKPKTIELKAGSCTFHNGLTFHYAGPNKTIGTREAFAIIYMPDGTASTGEPHIVTDALQPKPTASATLDGPMFPRVGHIK